MTATTDRTPASAPAAPPRRTGVRGMLIVIGLVLVVSGGLSLLSYAFRTSDTETATITEAVATIVIDTDAGSVEVAGADVDAVEVTVTKRWGLGEEPRTTADVEGNTLRLRGDCPTGWLFWWANPCSTTYEVVAPRDVAVRVTTAGGSVTVRDIEGGADLESSAGSVVLDNVGGTIRARSSAGAVTATVASTDVDVSSSAGSVSVADTIVPDRLNARSSAGSVEVVVPDEVYRVDASTSAGQTRVEVDTSQDAPRTISAVSSAGNVTVRRSNPR